MTPPPAGAATAPRVRPRRPPAPRRVSGPAKGAGAGRAAGSRGAPSRARNSVRIGAGGAVALPAPGGLALGLGRTLAGVSEQRWLDRLIRGRLWIGLIAFALIGIVAMQLWIVKLGVGIGRALEHEAFLQRENAALRIADAQLSSGERVEALAAARGMVVAAPGSLRFLRSRGGLDARLAAGSLARSGSEQQAHTAETTATQAGGTGGETGVAAGGASAGETTGAENGATGSAARETSAAAGGASGQTSPALGAAGATGAASTSGEAAGAGSASASGEASSGEAGATPSGAAATATPSSSAPGPTAAAGTPSSTSAGAATGAAGSGGASATGESSASGAGGAAPGG
jgi:hypothetical protein